jgi:hypothetical protein
MRWLLLILVGGCTEHVSGPHYGFRVTDEVVPSTALAAELVGLDIDGQPGVDNRLGDVFAFLNSGLVRVENVQVNTEQAFAMKLLVATLDIETASPDFVAAPVGIRQFAAAPDEVDLEAPTPAQLIGTIDDSGIATAGPGELDAVIAPFGTPLVVHLSAARARLSIRDGRVTGSVGGALLAAEVENITAAWQQSLVPILAADCVPSSSSCTCTHDSPAETLDIEFDADHDCAITIDEITTNPQYRSATAPDLHLDGHPAVSFGYALGAQRVTAP